jgi:hypothetical protein
MGASRRGYQFPYLGGVLTGVGFGLWLSPILANTGFHGRFGMVGTIFAGLVLVFLGVAVGLPTRPSRRRDEAD